MYPPYVSKYNSNREKQVVLLMISNEEKWSKKKLSPLLRQITSKHFHCLNGLHSFGTKKN